MFILAVNNNERVYAYNEQKQECLNVFGKLQGYTCETVAVKQGENIFIYGTNGQKIAQYPKDFIDLSNVVGVVL